jgi:alpha-ketoglutarate-dependent taurine dioxygenase
VLDVKDLTPTVGSAVTIDADTLVSGAHARELRELLVQRGALVFRGVDLDDDQLRAFTGTLGEVRMGTVYEQAGEGMLKIVDIAGAYFWHFDGAYTELPPFASVLAPRVIAPEGGQTEFANVYAAFDDLPADEQDHLMTIEVVHSMKAAFNDATPEPTLEQFQSWMGWRKTLPLVWTHTSGRRSLVLGATTSYVVGMHPADGHELLARLLTHATQDKYVYRHEWEPGDVVVWDNTGVMHRVRPFDLATGRLMHRFTIEGTETLDGAPVPAAAGSAA